MKTLVFSDHANVVLMNRGIDPAWAELAARYPDWTERDPFRAGVERRFKIIPERGGRVLRAACVEDTSSIRVITVFFDRDARRPEWL